MICPNCKNEIQDNTSFCPYCGMTLNGFAQEQMQPPQSNPSTPPNVPPAQPGRPVYPPYPGQGAPFGYPGAGNNAAQSYPGSDYIPTPMNEASPDTNQGATQPQFAFSQPTKKKRTGLILGLSIGGGVILLAIIALVLWFFVLGGSGTITDGGDTLSGFRPGSAVGSDDTYTTTCDDYIQQYESVLSELTGSTITVEQYEDEFDSYPMDYMILENGTDTDVRLCFYEEGLQVTSGDTFDTVMIDSWELTDDMSDLVVDSCAAAMLLADDQCSSADAARQQIRQWDEDSGREDCVKTLNGITYEFSYLTSWEFSSLSVVDINGGEYVSDEDVDSENGDDNAYSTPIGEYVPSEVRLESGESITYREYLEQQAEQSGMDPDSAEAQTVIDQGMNTSFYFHGDGNVEAIINGVSMEGTFEMSGDQAMVTLDGDTAPMEYDGGDDILLLEDDGLYLVLEYNGL